MAINGVSPKVGKILALPDKSVTIGTATDSGTGTSVSVAFTPGSEATGGPTLSYQALSNPGSITATGVSSPITVTGLTTGTAYTFQVIAQNPSGNSTAGYSSASNSVTPVNPSSFESIASVTASGSSTTMSLTSIPQTYTNLQLVISARGQNAFNRGDCYIRFNNDSAGDYSYRWLYTSGNGWNILASNSASAAYQSYMPGSSANSNLHGNFVMDINNYASTSANKSFNTKAFWAQSAAGVESNLAIVIGSWLNSTTGISSIDFISANGNLTNTSTMALYGWKAS